MQMEVDLAKANPDWYAVNQYHNPRNADAHQASTGPEVWAQTGGAVTHFVMTASTGGTITGTSRHLKEQVRRGRQSGASATLILTPISPPTPPPPPRPPPPNLPHPRNPEPCR